MVMGVGRTGMTTHPSFPDLLQLHVEHVHRIASAPPSPATASKPASGTPRGDTEMANSAPDAETTNLADTHQDKTVSNETIADNSTNTAHTCTARMASPECLSVCGKMLRIMGDEQTSRACGRHLRLIGDRIFFTYAMRHFSPLFHNMANEHDR